MKKSRWARRVLPLFIFILLCLVNTVPASAANYIKEIEMNVYIDSDGTANIEEIWHASLDSGTEGYKPYGNLGKSKIIDFTVSDDTGVEYEYESDWSIESGSYGFYLKKHKNSIHKVSGGVELCWGISEYGDRTYTLKYKITNFVNQYEDAQGVYFSLMPKEMDQSPSSVVITITSEHKFSVDNSKIWAFGYDGSINFKDGAIVMDSEGSLRSSGYMTALIKFEDDYFNAGNKVRKPFSKIYDEAMVGVEEENKKSTRLNLGSLAFWMPLRLLGSIVPFLLIIMLPRLLRTRRYAGRTINDSSKGFDFGLMGTKIPSQREVDYWREIPCDNDIMRAYWVAYHYSIHSKSDKSDIKSGLMGAILLKWLKLGYVKIIDLPPKMLSFKDNNYAVDFRHIDLRGMTEARNRIERRLLDIMITAAGSNGILEPKEFSKWCKKNYREVESWFEGAVAYETAELRSVGIITTTEEPAPVSFIEKLFKVSRTVTVEHVDISMRQEAIQVQGLKRFLLEFSAIAEREFIQVHVWEDYLIFAQLLGIADKVKEQFSKVYPDFHEMSQASGFSADVGSNLARDIAVAGCIAARQGRAAEARRSSGGSSSGGGGSSHSGGGSSAGGSSSGGGFR